MLLKSLVDDGPPPYSGVLVLRHTFLLSGLFPNYFDGSPYQWNMPRYSMGIPSRQTKARVNLTTSKDCHDIDVCWTTVCRTDSRAPRVGQEYMKTNQLRPTRVQRGDDNEPQIYDQCIETEYTNTFRFCRLTWWWAWNRRSAWLRTKLPLSIAMHCATNCNRWWGKLDWIVQLLMRITACQQLCKVRRS